MIKRVPGDGAKKLQNLLDNLKTVATRVGWFAESRYPESPHLQVAEVAAQNEYGVPAKRIPPRPFMRPTATRERKNWNDIATRGAKAVLNGTTTTFNVMEQIGQKSRFDVQKTISSIWSPPLSPITIAIRLSKRHDKKHIGNLDKPLIDTGLMFNTLISKTGIE